MKRGSKHGDQDEQYYIDEITDLNCITLYLRNKTIRRQPFKKLLENGRYEFDQTIIAHSVTYF